MPLDPVPLSAEAQDLLDRLRPRIEARLAEANRVPVSVLLWGPGVGSPSALAAVRRELRDTLRSKGHAAMYSEELYDDTSNHSLRLQELAQALEFDLIVSTPATPGSLGEIHDFAADRRVNGRMLAFLNQQHLSGYSSQSITALATIISCKIVYYPSEMETQAIVETTLNEVQKIREMKYITSGRYS